MRVRCDRCGYKTVEWAKRSAVIDQLKEEGGHVDNGGLTCPNGHPVEPAGPEKGKAAPGDRPSPGTNGAAILAALASVGIGVDMALPGLILTAWKFDRRRFGLKGSELEHPDSNKVICELVKSLVPGRYLDRVAPSVYQLTELGLVRGRELREGIRRQPA